MRARTCMFAYGCALSVLRGRKEGVGCKLTSSSIQMQEPGSREVGCKLTGSIQIQADQCDQIRMSRRHCTMDVVLWETETDDCHRFHMRDARSKRTI
jgi:hypothetical protein